MFHDGFSAPNVRIVECRGTFLYREARDEASSGSYPFPELTSLELLTHELPRLSKLSNLTHLRILAPKSIPRMRSYEQTTEVIELPSLRVFSIYIRNARGGMTLNAPALRHLQLLGDAFDPLLPPLIANSTFQALVTFEVYSSYIWRQDTSDLATWLAQHSNLRRVLIPLPGAPIDSYGRFLYSLTSPDFVLHYVELIQLYRSPQMPLIQHDLELFYLTVATLWSRKDLRVECMNAGKLEAPTESVALAVKPLGDRWKWVGYEDVFHSFFLKREHLREESVLLGLGL